MFSFSVFMFLLGIVMILWGVYNIRQLRKITKIENQVKQILDNMK